MQEASVDLANAEPGEACFLVQICLPELPGGHSDALTDKISRFVELYLSAAQPGEARFAQMAALTWRIAAPQDAESALEGLRADLAATLFGADDGQQVQLEAPGRDTPDVAEEVPEDAAEDDAWVEAAEPAQDIEAEFAPIDGQDVFVVDPEEALETVESVHLDDGAFDLGPGAPDPLSKEDEGEDWEMAGATAARRAAFDDDSDVFEVDGLDIEIVDAEMGESDDAPSAPMPVLESPALETLTEPPARPADRDIASELAAFRAEMREIASSIPGGGGGAALSAFRAELDAIAGAMGQRVDGAAQRIESAADRIAEVGEHMDGARLSGAAARAQTSAERLEKGVEEALGALNAAVKAMNGVPLGDASGAAG